MEILILLCGSIESSYWRAANDIDLVSNLLFTIRKIGSHADCTTRVQLQAPVRRQCICINTNEAKNQGINWPFVVAVHSMCFFSRPFHLFSGVVWFGEEKQSTNETLIEKSMPMPIPNEGRKIWLRQATTDFEHGRNEKKNNQTNQTDWRTMPEKSKLNTQKKIKL